MQKTLAFVVQKHLATAIHYDLRLEVGGTMISWAIPKGPTLDHSVKRLAMQTQDHGFDYRKFEGTIPEGYGAGKVIIWDKGYYYPEIEVQKGLRQVIRNRDQGEKIMKEGIANGQLKFTLFGKKLKGSFAMVKTKNFGPKNSWLLLKHKDSYSVAGYDPNFDESLKSNGA